MCGAGFPLGEVSYLERAPSLIVEFSHEGPKADAADSSLRAFSTEVDGGP